VAQRLGDPDRQWVVPPGAAIELPGRGTTFVREVAGPRRAPTVILLHGLAATGGLNWFAAFGPLGRQFRVVALDHRGHGRGLRTSEPFSLDDCADDVVAVADRLGIDTFIPVGYSMGGPIAQLVWRRHPERVDGLVLCATSRDFRGRWHERVQFAGLGLVVTGLRLAPMPAVERLAEQLPEELVDTASRRWAFDELRRHDIRSVLEAAEALGRFSSRDWIGGIDVPVSVVVTSQDKLVPPRRQVKLADAIPSAVIHVVDGTHLAAGTEPDLFASTLVDASRLVARRAAKRPPARTRRRAPVGVRVDRWMSAARGRWRLRRSA
jgi:pimeloyl-ACP methyl ester carboxylesterase